MSEQRQVIPTGMAWDAVRQQAIEDAHRTGIPLGGTEGDHVAAGVDAVLGLIVGKVVMVEDANRVLAEERDNMATIADERTRYRDALELLRSCRGDPVIPSAGETMVRAGWIYEVVNKALGLWKD